MSYFGAPEPNPKWPRTNIARSQPSSSYIKEDFSACANATTVCARISISNVAVLHPSSPAPIRSGHVHVLVVTHLSSTYTNKHACLYCAHSPHRTLGSAMGGKSFASHTSLGSLFVYVHAIQCACARAHTSKHMFACIHALVFFQMGKPN